MTGRGDGVDLTGTEDDRLIDELRQVLAHVDPVPSSIMAIGSGLLSWRDPDTELAALVADSRELAGMVRDRSSEVLLRFATDGVSVVVEVVPDLDGGYHLTGQIEPGGSGTVEVRRPGAQPAEGTVRADQWGRFDAAVSGGTLGIRWTPDDRTREAVHTAWVVV